MTLQEYMDPKRFPLTTQKGLTPKQQFFIDSFNFDNLKEHVEEEGGTLTSKQEAIRKELDEKMKASEDGTLFKEAAKEQEQPHA